MTSCCPPSVFISKIWECLLNTLIPDPFSILESPNISIGGPEIYILFSPAESDTGGL